MTQELRIRNQSQQLYNRALSSAVRNAIQLYDPSMWLLRDPEAEEKMLRHVDIAGAIGRRQGLIAGRDWNIVPMVESSPRAPISVMIATELLKGIKHFTEGRYNLSRAFFSGSRFAVIHGEARTMNIGDGKPRTWWVPIRLEDVDKRMFRIVSELDDVEGTLNGHWEKWNLVKQQWEPETNRNATQTVRHVYQDDQSTLGYGRALREALGMYWYFSEHVLQESIQALERFGQGIIVAKIHGVRDAETGLPNEELIAQWLEVLEDVRSRHVLVQDMDDKIEIISPSGEGWQMFKDIKEELKNGILTLVLHANLPSAANDGGSFALAAIQENSTEALVQFDRRELEETLSDDLIGCLWEKNRPNMAELGIANEKPLFTIKQEKIQNPQERATVAQTLSSMGVELALDDVLEQTGFRKPEEGEDKVEGTQGDLFAPGGFSGGGLPSLPSLSSLQPGQPGPVEIQDTAMNGAQVTAAAELIDRVVHNQMPPGTAVRMLVSMFNLPPDDAKEMVAEAVAFQPAPKAPAAVPTP